MSRFWEATWSLKTGHQVVHLAVGRKLVVAIRMRHVRRIFGKSMYSVLEDSRPLVRVLVQEVLWQTGGGAFWECCREIFWGWLLLLEGRFFFGESPGWLHRESLREEPDGLQRKRRKPEF